MFQLADPKRSFKWPVKVKFPDGKGKTVEKSFAVSFFFRSDDELKELIVKHDDEAFLVDVIDKFHELKDHLGNSIKGTKEDIKLICSNSRIKKAVIEAYYEFNNGAEKN